MNSSDMVIFTRTYDLVKWVLPRTAKFPKYYRHNVVARLIAALLDFQESLLMAETTRDQIRLRHLKQADGHLSKLRLYLRLAHEWEWLSVGQYEHVSRMVAEIGRLLNGWITSTRPAR